MWHLTSRLSRKILAHTVCFWLNRHFFNPLQFEQVFVDKKLVAHDVISSNFILISDKVLYFQLKYSWGFFTTINLLIMTTSENKYEIQKTEQEWKETLTPEQFKVLRKHGTERPGTSPLDKVYDQGTYICAGCGQPLFNADAKFDSGTGWPSFYQPLEDAIDTKSDRSLFVTRTEVHCNRCGGHLGHVFDDGPEPTGLRYCMNGVSLEFAPEK